MVLFDYLTQTATGTAFLMFLIPVSLFVLTGGFALLESYPKIEKMGTKLWVGSLISVGATGLLTGITISCAVLAEAMGFC